MLQPDDTVLLTEALRPPEGCHVDVAVATTYSLNLTAILIAPMTFALHDVTDVSTASRHDPIELLHAAQKYLSRTTVFCQSAAIHVPSSYSEIFDFLEDSIVPVRAPRQGALFHPKIWAVRYRNEDGAAHHRLLIASRNLTLDNARDTLLMLEEAPSGEIAGTSAARFIQALPELAVMPIPVKRRAEIADLAQTLRAATFGVPSPFTGGHLVPLGLDDDTEWPFPDDSHRVLALSPFLAAGTLERLRGRGKQNVLVSRPEEIDRLGARILAHWDLNVLSGSLRLNDAAPTIALDEFTAIPAVDDEDTSLIFDGLHAKTVVADGPGGISTTITGSANLTESGWFANVEFGAVLTGPTALCGIDAVLDEQGDSPGLRAVLQPYTPRTEYGEADPATATSIALEAFHQALALSTPRLDVLGGEDTVLARLDLTVPDDAPGRTEFWLITVPVQKLRLGEPLEWEISPQNVTPFIAVRTTAGSGEARVTRTCCLLVPLAGDVPDRRQATLSALLSDPERMLRYLSFLLGIDDPYGVRVDTVALEDAETAGAEEATPPALPPVVLFEPLLRAASRSPGHLASIAEQIAELRQVPEVDRLIPEEFARMWDVVLDATRERRHR